MFVNTDAHKFDSIEDNRRSNETMSSNLSHDFIIENNYVLLPIGFTILNIQEKSPMIFCRLNAWSSEEWRE